MYLSIPTQSVLDNRLAACYTETRGMNGMNATNATADIMLPECEIK
jgi:hypothetical protein